MKQADQERIGPYLVHPVASLFPLMEAEEFDELVESIEGYGQKLPIVVHEGVLLDGRNRLKACLKLGIPPLVEQYKPRPNVKIGSWIITMNIHRRHLTPDQKIAIVAEAFDIMDAATIKEHQAAAGVLGKEYGIEGGRGHKKEAKNPLPPIDGKGFSAAKTHKAAKTHDRHARSTVGQLAAAAHESERKAAQIIAVKKHAPELADAVRSGTVKLKNAAKQAHAKQPSPAAPKPKSFDMEKIMRRLVAQFERVRDEYPEDKHEMITREFIETLERL